MPMTCWKTIVIFYFWKAIFLSLSRKNKMLSITKINFSLCYTIPCDVYFLEFGLKEGKGIRFIFGKTPIKSKR